MPFVSPVVPASGALLIGLLTTTNRGDSDGTAALPKAARPEVRSQSNGQTVGSLPMGMVLVPGGKFQMGADEKEVAKFLTETQTLGSYGNILVSMIPAHEETVGELLVDRAEVSNLQYQNYLEANGLQPAQELYNFNWISQKNGKPVKGLPEGQEAHPIRAVNFEQAQACARWLGKRLPSEVEWEHFARRTLRKDQYYPWGSGFAAWDKTKCANSDSSAKGADGPETFKPGSWAEDVSADGIVDLCGNVGEWTTSRFEPYKGFEPLVIKDKKNKISLRGEFDGEKMVVRGGSYLGNNISNNLVVRYGQYAKSYLEAVGFRCVMSVLPGLDALRDAEKSLAVASGDVKGTLDYGADAVGATIVQYLDSTTNLVRECRHLAFARTLPIAGSLLKIQKESIEKPVLVGVVATNATLAAPALPPGAYAVYFKGKGATQAQKQLEIDAKKKPKGANAKEAGKVADAPAAVGSDRKSEPAEKAGAGGKADPTEEKVVQVVAKEIPLAELPVDRDLILFKSPAGAVVGWLPAKYAETSAHATRFSYTQGSGGTAAKSSVEKAGAEPLALNDVASLVFSARMGNGNKCPAFTLELEFEPGTFQPVVVPAPAGK